MRQNGRNHRRQSSTAAIMDRRAFLSYMPMAFGALSAPGILIGKAQAQSVKYVVAKTIYGSVRGLSRNGVMIFKGIPYAASPAGQNRFKPAPKLKPRTGVRDALLYDPVWQPGPTAAASY